MKFLATFICIIFCITAHTQTASVKWGDEMKVRKGSIDLTVVHEDKSGVYLKEGHLALKAYFVIGTSTRESATLIKTDFDFNEIYRNNFNKELKGKNYEDLLFIGDKIFLIGNSYNKKEKSLILYSTELNATDGTQKGEWKEIFTLQKEEKRDDFMYTIQYNNDTTGIYIISALEMDELVKYEITEYSNTLEKVGKTMKVVYPIEPKKFDLENMIHTNEGNLLIVSKLFEYREGKKQKNKFLDFKEYDVRLYDKEGKFIKQVNLTSDGKWLLSSHAQLMHNGDVALGAFYSNTRKNKEINGVTFMRINSITGDLLSQGNQELSTAMITDANDDDDDDEDGDGETKKERKEREKMEKLQEKEEGFSQNYSFRAFLPTPDNGFIMLAERYRRYAVTHTYYNGKTTTTTTTWYDESAHLLFTKVTDKSEVKWIHVLPKRQTEVVGSSSSTRVGMGGGSSTYFLRGYGSPFLGGVGTMVAPNNNNLLVFFNDHPKNSAVINVGQKYKSVRKFNKTDCFMLNVNQETGKYTRTSIFSNEDIPICMPRHGRVINNSFFVVGRQLQKLGKTKIAIGKIAIK